MKKTLIAATSAFALVLGFSGASVAQEFELGANIAVSVQILDQYVSNSFDNGDHSSGNVQTGEHSFSDGMANGDHTFTHQILNVNGFNQGINGTNQGAISVAVAANFQGN